MLEIKARKRRGRFQQQDAEAMCLDMQHYFSTPLESLTQASRSSTLIPKSCTQTKCSYTQTLSKRHSHKSTDIHAHKPRYGHLWNALDRDEDLLVDMMRSLCLFGLHMFVHAHVFTCTCMAECAGWVDAVLYFHVCRLVYFACILCLRCMVYVCMYG